MHTDRSLLLYPKAQLNARLLRPSISHFCSFVVVTLFEKRSGYKRSNGPRSAYLKVKNWPKALKAASLRRVAASITANAAMSPAVHR